MSANPGMGAPQRQRDIDAALDGLNVSMDKLGAITDILAERLARVRRNDPTGQAEKEGRKLTACPLADILWERVDAINRISLTLHHLTETLEV